MARVEQAEDQGRLVLSATLVGDWALCRPVGGLDKYFGRDDSEEEDDEEEEGAKEEPGLEQLERRGAAFVKPIWFPLNPEAPDMEEAKAQLLAAAMSELEDYEEHGGGLDQLRADSFPFEANHASRSES